MLLTTAQSTPGSGTPPTADCHRISGLVVIPPVHVLPFLLGYGVLRFCHAWPAGHLTLGQDPPPCMWLRMASDVASSMP